ncbi:MAG: hypothetical protein ACOC0Z_06755, partial [Halohasta sp.]
AREVLFVSLSAVRQILEGVTKSGLRLLRDDMYFGFDFLLAEYLEAVRYGSELPVSAAEGHRIFEAAYDVIEFEA